MLKVARDLAGFTPGQGEQLRRALGAKRAEEEIEKFRAAFVAGATGRGVPAAVAATVFDQLRAFGGYSFAKSHAAAFAVLVYQSAWLKRYHFAAFYAALLNNQPMGFWTPAVLVNEIKRIIAARDERPFDSLLDFCRRTRIGRRAVENLILAGAMDGWGIARVCYYSWLRNGPWPAAPIFFVLNQPAAAKQTKEVARRLWSELEGRLATTQVEAAQAGGL